MNFIGNRVILTKDGNLVKTHIRCMLGLLFGGAVILALSHFAVQALQSVYSQSMKQGLQIALTASRLTVVTIMVLFYSVLGFSIKSNFKEGLKAVDPHGKRARRAVGTHVTALVMLYVANCTYFLAKEVSNVVYIAVVLFILIGVLLTGLLDLFVTSIYSFRYAHKYDSPGEELVALNKDISILLKGGKRAVIDLTHSELYICSSNDIMVIDKCGEPHIYKKETIKSLNIKSAIIMYINGDWVKAN